MFEILNNFLDPSNTDTKTPFRKINVLPWHINEIPLSANLTDMEEDFGLDHEHSAIISTFSELII